MIMNTGAKILIVDDEQYLRTSLGLLLERAGYSITMASSGKDALDTIRVKHYDLVFLDLRMPDMDGLEVLPLLLEAQPGIPVLILTANSSLDMAIEAMSLGASGYLLKPIDPDQILIRIREVIRDMQQSRRRSEIINEIRGIVTQLQVNERY